jgi:dUTP pyrophosphatase
VADPFSVVPLGAPDGATVTVRVRLLHEQAQLPAYARPGDAGADLHAVAEARLAPGERALVRTGIAIAIPPGWVGLVHPRSGLAARHGISIVNAPGTIDSGYRGEVLVNLINLDRQESFTVRPGDRIAQLVLQQVSVASFFPTESLPDTARGDTGHGSTGGFGHAVPTTAPATFEEHQ